VNTRLPDFFPELPNQAGKNTIGFYVIPQKAFQKQLLRDFSLVFEGFQPLIARFLRMISNRFFSFILLDIVKIGSIPCVKVLAVQ
jgi:hypothetical protein